MFKRILFIRKHRFSRQKHNYASQTLNVSHLNWQLKLLYM